MSKDVDWHGKTVHTACVGSDDDARKRMRTALFTLAIRRGLVLTPTGLQRLMPPSRAVRRPVRIAHGIHQLRSGMNIELREGVADVGFHSRNERRREVLASANGYLTG
jgi:hypothetical protein